MDLEKGLFIMGGMAMKKEPTVRPEQKTIRLHAECINYVGLKRKNNEDCLCINEYWLQPEDMNKNVVCSQDVTLSQALYGVFDGVGGDPHGECASCAAACYFSENRNDILRDVNDREALIERFKEANEKVCRGGNGSGTTAVVLLVTHGQAHILNAGDSGAYLFRDGVLRPIFTKHTADLPDEAPAVRSHVITRYLGEVSEAQLYVPSIAEMIPLEHDDLFLLCSDGLTDMVNDIQIEAILQRNMDDRKKAETLVNRAMEGGGRDNTTVMLVRMQIA